MPSRLFRSILLFAILTMICDCCRATLIVVVIATDGIVIASDSKVGRMTPTGIGKQPKLAHKIVVLNDRIAIATVGMGWLQMGTRPGIAAFDFDSARFLNEVKNSLPTNASESSIERVIVEKLHGTIDALSPYVANGTLNKQNAPGIPYLIQFIIIWYEHGVPSVRRVTVECDWNTRKISSPVVKTEYPVPNRPTYINLAFFGEYDAVIRSVGDPQSPEHRAMEERYPMAKKEIAIDGGKIPPAKSAESILFAADFIRLQSEFDSEFVGPPIDFVVLTRAGPPRVSSLPK